MPVKPFSNNQEFYDYLLRFRDKLKARGSEELSDVVDFAIAQAGTSSTEFLGESRIAIQQVLEREDAILSTKERADLLDILNQLDGVLPRR